MLDMGFSDDIVNIVDKIPVKRQTLLFSATMPNKIRSFASRILTEPEEIRLAVSKPAAGIDQQFYLAYDNQKLPLLAHLIKTSTKPVNSMVLFTSRKSEVNSIVRTLSKLGYEARGISSDLEQDAREVVLRDFKNKAFPILVATDVLSRGIDIDNLTHVVNYDTPRDAEDYVHRIGRTARAATTGTAITFISDQDQNRIVAIEKLIERDLDKQSITEELGMGKSPVYDPKRFSGLRGKGSSGRSNGGRPDNRGRSNDRSRSPRENQPASTDAVPTVAADGETPSETKRPPRNDRRRRRKGGTPPTSEQASVAGENGAVEAVAVQPAGAESASIDKPKRRKKRRRPSGEKPTNGETTATPVPTPVAE
jgi:superfamily II DNA/RNA helicase